MLIDFVKNGFDIYGFNNRKRLYAHAFNTYALCIRGKHIHEKTCAYKQRFTILKIYL